MTQSEDVSLGSGKKIRCVIFAIFSMHIGQMIKGLIMAKKKVGKIMDD